MMPQIQVVNLGDALKAYQTRYRETHREEAAAKAKAYREVHREEVKAYRARYREVHREEVAARHI